MKQRSTTPASLSFTSRATLVAASILMAIATPMAFSVPAKADRFDDQIAALEREINQYNNQAKVLGKERNTYENKLAQFNAEKAQIQTQINLYEAKAKKLAADIVANEKKIDQNKQALGETIADMYVDDNISPLEMLASSKNVGDYVDKQAYRSSIQDTLDATIKEIKTLKQKLEDQKKDVERALTDQKSARQALSQKEAEQQELIRKVRGKEQAFQKLSAQSRAERDSVQQAQQAAIAAAMRAAGGGGGSAVAGDPGKGGYPSNLANSDYYNAVVDPWGMYSRQCVSYTAWKVYQKNGYMPYWGGVGNANQWPSNARAAGIPVKNTPRAGSVGVIMAGAYGHVVWVESVNGDGTINISQYNYFNAGGSGWGHYSEMYNVSPGAYDYYIYF